MKQSFRAVAWTTMLALLLVTLIACGPAGGKPAAEESAADAAHSDVEVGEAVGEAPDDAIHSSVDTESPVVEAPVEEGELEYIEIEAGTGAQPNPGDTVFVHYTGKLEDGTVFDSSVERGTPLDFVLGQGRVIAGWDQGIAMMKEGGKATLIIPPNLGYGAQGAGETIPPNATLIFDVELVSVVKQLEPAEVSEADYTTLESGIQFYDIEAGEGDPVAEGDRISVHFAAWSEMGALLVNSRDQGPAVYTLGTTELFLNDWDEAVVGMKVGGLRQIFIPAGAGGNAAPPEESLTLELELVETVEPIVQTEVDEADYTITESGLKYYDIVVGEGDLVEAGATVSVHYTGWLQSTGDQLDSSEERGEPVEFPLGIGAVIPGWDEGILGMQVGGRRQLVLTPALGFGEAGNGPIPPDSVLVFEIELVGATAAAPVE